MERVAALVQKTHEDSDRVILNRGHSSHLRGRLHSTSQQETTEIRLISDPVIESDLAVLLLCCNLRFDLLKLSEDPRIGCVPVGM